MAKCANEYCLQEEKFYDEFTQVEEKSYCPLHAGPAARSAKLLRDLRALQLRVEELRRARNNQIAKNYLTQKDYRAWDKFQGDLADYHRNTGNLAPERLRKLGPHDWWEYHRRNGPIDVQAAADELIEAERKANLTREWLLKRDLG